MMLRSLDKKDDRNHGNVKAEEQNYYVWDLKSRCVDCEEHGLEKNVWRQEGHLRGLCYILVPKMRRV